MKKNLLTAFSGLLTLFVLFNPAGVSAQFTVLNESNSDLPNDFIQKIRFDANNNMYLATDIGFVKKVGNTWTLYNNTNSELVNINVQTMDIVSPTEIWIGTVGGPSVSSGVFLYDGQTVSHIEFGSETDIPTSVYAIKKLQNGNVIIGSSPYTYIYDGTTLTNMGNDGPGFAESFIEKDGILWIGSYANGLYKYDGTTWTNYRTTNSNITSNYVERIAIDSQNNIWMGGFGSQEDTKGLIKFDGTTFTNYAPSNSDLPRRQIYELVIDSQDDIWIANGSGNTPGGLVKFDGDDDFTLWTENNSNLPTNMLLSLQIDNDNKLAIGTYGEGLCYYQIAIMGTADFEKSGIAVYPNPAKDVITFSAENDFGGHDAEVVILDLAGKVIKKDTINKQQNTVSVSGIAGGVYMYQLKVGGIIIEQAKIIIE